MTRFQKELSGALGAFWKKEAEAALDKIRAKLDAGEITIDGDGVARNCIGRALMEDMLEQLAMVTDKVNVEATQTARDAEVKKSLEAYRAARREPSVEELAEMRATFGAGTTVVDALTGKEIKL